MVQETKVILENTPINIEKYIIRNAGGRSGSKKKGTRVLFLGAIHGDEPCGPAAIRTLVEKFSTGKLRVLKGSIICVPVCNPKAFALGVRYCDENLNRIFKHHADPQTYEARIADELTSLVDQCDVLIDFHSTSAPSVPFVFLDYRSKANRQLAAATGISNIVTGWIELYKKLGKINPQRPTYDTGYYAHKKGKMALTIECGENQSVSSERAAYRSAVNVLRYFGVIKGGTRVAQALAQRQQRQKALRLYRVYFKDSVGDVLVKRWKNLEPVSRGQVIARRASGAVIYAFYDGCVVMPKHNASIGEEWFYLAKSE